MNSFKKYAKDIKHIILKNKNSLNINNISNIDNIIVESPLNNLIMIYLQMSLWF